MFRYRTFIQQYVVSMELSPSDLLDSSKEDRSLAHGQAVREKGRGEYKEPKLSANVVRLCT